MTTPTTTKVCDNTRLFVRSLDRALANRRDDELRLHVQALRDTLAEQVATHDAQARS